MSDGGEVPGAAGMATDVPLPPHGTPEFKRRDGKIAGPALRILVPYLGMLRDPPSADLEMDADAVAREIAALCPSVGAQQ